MEIPYPSLTLCSALVSLPARTVEPSYSFQTVAPTASCWAIPHLVSQLVIWVSAAMLSSYLFGTLKYKPFGVVYQPSISRQVEGWPRFCAKIGVMARAKRRQARRGGKRSTSRAEDNEETVTHGKHANRNRLLGRHSQFNQNG